jgi:Flp pilus assembly protein TadD
MSAGSQEAKSPTSSLEKALRRAQDCINRNNYTQAIAELREVLKLDPNHSTCHSLLGIAYIRQNQMTMAKVHINKAFAANPKDPMAIAAKKELAAASPKESGKDGSEKGFLSGFFNTKKK